MLELSDYNSYLEYNKIFAFASNCQTFIEFIYPVQISGYDGGTLVCLGHYSNKNLLGLKKVII